MGRTAGSRLTVPLGVIVAGLAGQEKALAAAMVRAHRDRLPERPLACEPLECQNCRAAVNRLVKGERRCPACNSTRLRRPT